MGQNTYNPNLSLSLRNAITGNKDSLESRLDILRHLKYQFVEEIVSRSCKEVSGSCLNSSSEDGYNEEVENKEHLDTFGEHSGD